MPKHGDVYDASCSARDTLELIASKWAMLILPALAAGPVRNAALLRRIGGISQKVLTQTLRDLERSGLIVREDKGTLPRCVEYRLSQGWFGIVMTRHPFAVLTTWSCSFETSPPFIVQLSSTLTSASSTGTTLVIAQRTSLKRRNMFSFRSFL